MYSYNCEILVLSAVLIQSVLVPTQPPRQHRLPLEAAHQPRRFPETAPEPDSHQDSWHLQRKECVTRPSPLRSECSFAALTSLSAGAGFLDDVSLVTARRGPGVPARWVEQCDCPQGYQGQHCEQCTLGYRRARPDLGAFSPCEPCSCNGHSDACNPVTGTAASLVDLW